MTFFQLDTAVGGADLSNQAEAKKFIDNINLLFAQGKFHELVSLISPIAENSKDPTFLNLLAVSFWRSGDTERAAEIFCKLIESDAGNYAARDQLCTILEVSASKPWVGHYLTKLHVIYGSDPGLSRLVERTALQVALMKELTASQRAVRYSESLHNIGRRYGTDKSSVQDIHTWSGMSFLDVYEKYFLPYRDNTINFLEIGVLRGDSLRTWEEYFPNGTIYGLDINPEVMVNQRGRVNITIGSQGSDSDLQALCKKAGHFDIVLDDGSHATTHMLTSFKNLFPAVSPGGLYIIEDLGCTYGHPDMNWPGMKYNPEKQLVNNRQEFEKFFLEKIEDIDKERGEVLSVHFWHLMVVILKKPAIKYS